MECDAQEERVEMSEIFRWPAEGNPTTLCNHANLHSCRARILRKLYKIWCSDERIRRRTVRLSSAGEMDGQAVQWFSPHVIATQLPRHAACMFLNLLILDHYSLLHSICFFN